MASQQNEKHFFLGSGCMLLAVIFWGINIPATKALIPEYMTADSISVVRLAGGCILFWLASLFVKCEPIKKEDWGRIFLGGFAGLFAFIYLFILSLRYGSPIDISIIMTLPPMFVILIGVIFQHLRPSALEYAGIAISFAGAVIVILGGSGPHKEGADFLWGDFLAIISALCYALYLVILEKPSHTYTPLSLLRWVFLFGALPTVFIMPGMQDLPILHSAELVPWLEIVFILLFPSFLAYFLVQPAIKNIGSELASIYQYLIPVVASIATVLMGLETLRFSQEIAMAVIVCGMVLTNVGKKKRLAAN